MLLTGVITHGYNPIYLLTRTLVSLPKDTCGNICDSDNYRGICLCSCITKVLEWCIMLRYITSWQHQDYNFHLNLAILQQCVV